MTPFTCRGVPRSLARDGWWLSAAADGRTAALSTPAKTPKLSRPFGLAFAAVIAADVLFWPVSGGIGLALFSLVFAACIVVGLAVPTKRAKWIAAIAFTTALPVLSFVQPLSVAWWVLGLVAMPLAAAQAPIHRLAAFTRGWLTTGILAVVDDIALQVTQFSGGKGFVGFLRQWGLALGLGLTFLALFSIANPVIHSFGEFLGQAVSLFEISADRIGLWLAVLGGLAAAAACAFVALPDIQDVSKTQKINLFSSQSVTNALLVFNLIFAVQLGSDLSIFVFGSGLPNGVSFAEYAHRGAYPLVVTALMAGAFMLIARGQLGHNALLKPLLVLWWLQNLILLGTAGYRLAIYIEAYGLTYLRLHAGIWMGLVGFGLGLIAWDLWRRQPDGWIVKRSIAASALVLYTACFVNFGAAVTTFNMNRTAAALPVDWHYIDQMGVSAQAAFVREWAAQGGHGFALPFQREPIDNWRKFDFRRWQIDRSITQTLQGAKQ